MQIKKVIVGNKDEAFIENRFNDGINIIFSDDNNKGKTIVIQSMLYAMGNDPIFPSSFSTILSYSRIRNRWRRYKDM